MTGGRSQTDGGRVALVVGGDSLVGSAVHAQCRALGIPVAISSRRKGENAFFLDLSDPDFGPLERARYQFAVICAAVTDMRACQDDPVGTRRVNVDNTIELMRRLADKGTHLLFLSSSQVFDGEMPAPSEDAATNPRNEYGAQKLAVEQAIARYELPAAILRVTKILGKQPVGIFKVWLEALAKGNAIHAATNIAVSPVMVDEVARAARLLAAGRHRGIWHFAALDEMSYFEAAQLLAKLQHKPASLVIGEALTEAQVPLIYRPRYTTLSSQKLSRTLDMPLRHARDVLKAHSACLR